MTPGSRNPIDRANRAARRAELKEAIDAACRTRGDSKRHRDRCREETLEEPESTWDWWLEYWRGQYKPVRVAAS